MRKGIFLLLTISFFCSLCYSGLDKAFEFSTMELPRPVAVENQVGAFINDTLLLAGGIDPQGEASEKIYALRPNGEGGFALIKEFDFGEPIGACKSVYNQSGLFLAGLRGEASRLIYQVIFTGDSFEKQRLKPMPQAVDVIGIDFIGSLLCVFGLDSDNNENVLLTLNTELPESGWTIEQAFPGEVLTQSVVKSNYGMLHIIGGTLASDGSVTDACYGWRSKPLDGTAEDGWLKLSSIGQKIVEADAFVTGQAHIGLYGRVADSGGKQNTLLIYHSITDTWVSAINTASSFNGGSAVKIDDGFLFTGTPGNRLPLIKTKPTVGNLKIADYVVMGVYFSFLAGIGAFFARKQDNTEEFALGGRKIKWWAAGISMFATGASSISFMAIPTQVYRTSLIWIAPMLVVIPYYFVQAYLLFPLLRRLNIISTYEYLQRRFHPMLRLLASFQCIAFQTFGRISIVMLLPSLAISAATGLNVYLSVLLMGVLTTLYTTFGGFEAVIWTDCLQGLLMIGGGALMIWFAISGLPGGAPQFLDIGGQYDKFNLFIGGWDITLALGSFLIIQQLIGLFAQTADQPVIQRVFSIPMNDVRKLSATFALFGILIAVVVQFMGLSIFSYFHTNPEKLDPLMTNDQIVPLFVIQTLPVGVSGLIIAAIFAASMSTLSSSINSVSALISEDFFCRFKKNATDKQQLFVMKASSLIVGLFGTATALFMASLNITSIFQLWFEICALIGGGFVGMYFLGMFTKRANSAGAVTGALFSVVCTIMVKIFIPIHWSTYATIAVISCVLVGYIVSIIYPSQERDLTGLTVYKD
jgi:solute:Na+ symporter, SSS family